MYGSGYGHSDIHYPHHVGYGSYYLSYGGLGYYYPSYSSTTYIYTPVYVDPAYDILDDSEFDEDEDERTESLPADGVFDDSIDAEADLDPERAADDDLALHRLLIELDELPENLLSESEADQDSSPNAQERDAEPQGVR